MSSYPIYIWKLIRPGSRNKNLTKVCSSCWLIEKYFLVLSWALFAIQYGIGPIKTQLFLYMSNCINFIPRDFSIIARCSYVSCVSKYSSPIYNSIRMQPMLHKSLLWSQSQHSGNIISWVTTDILSVFCFTENDFGCPVLPRVDKRIMRLVVPCGVAKIYYFNIEFFWQKISFPFWFWPCAWSPRWRHAPFVFLIEFHINWTFMHNNSYASFANFCFTWDQ